MNTATVTELVRTDNGAARRPEVGERVEVGRYTVPTAGERVIYGQRVNGVVRFLVTMADVLVSSSSRGEDSRCLAREGS